MNDTPRDWSVDIHENGRSGKVVYAPGRWGPTVVTLVVGGLAWAAFALWLHGLLMGIRVMG